ncbi:hypothetical protein T484DRAFT_1847689 [Baffinella frigidus]|nr:hypothetical protein T484DRAFT_1847689 [Cryptophyta sp. CCMP2293]
MVAVQTLSRVKVTNVCNADGKTGCISFMFVARPKDCGDGKRLDPEECDDSNIEPGDGCNEHCEIEPGFRCTGGGRFAADSCSYGQATQRATTGFRE